MAEKLCLVWIKFKSWLNQIQKYKVVNHVRNLNVKKTKIDAHTNVKPKCETESQGNYSNSESENETKTDSETLGNRVCCFVLCVRGLMWLLLRCVGEDLSELSVQTELFARGVLTTSPANSTAALPPSNSLLSTISQPTQQGKLREYRQTIVRPGVVKFCACCKY